MSDAPILMMHTRPCVKEFISQARTMEKDLKDLAKKMEESSKKAIADAIVEEHIKAATRQAVQVIKDQTTTA